MNKKCIASTVESFKSAMVKVKGNDGKAIRKARDRLYAFVFVMTAAAGVLAIVTFAVIGTDMVTFSDAKRKKQHGNFGRANWAPAVVSTKDAKGIRPILEGSVHLIEIHVAKLVTKKGTDYYDGIEAEFCALDWNEYKNQPWKLPMYRDLLNKSSNCRSGRIVVNLKTLMEEVYRFDEQPSTKTKIRSLKPNFIFHESRCGSTLLANVLQYYDPKGVRVHSEAGPALTALRICGDNYEHCSENVARKIVRDVFYLMGRVPSLSGESRLFFKMQSSATANLNLVHKSFPDAPWVFVYRDPEEVLVSHLQIPHKERAKCLQSRRHPPHGVVEILEQSRLTAKDLSEEEYCAIYLSSICKNALEAVKLSKSKGKLLNYENILDKFIYDILPNHFGMTVGSKEMKRIELAGSKYSKSRDEDSIWTEDSTFKHDSATDAIRQASDKYLAFSYVELEGFNKKSDNI